MEKDETTQTRVSERINDSMLALFKVICLNPKDQDMKWFKKTFKQQSQLPVKNVEKMIRASVKYTLQIDLCCEQTLKPFFQHNPKITNWLRKETWNDITEKSGLEKWIMINRMTSIILKDGSSILDVKTQKSELRNYTKEFLGKQTAPIEHKSLWRRMLDKLFAIKTVTPDYLENTKSISDSRLCRIAMESFHCIKMCPPEHLAKTFNMLNGKNLTPYLAIPEVRKKAEYVFKQVMITWYINANVSAYESNIYVN